MIYVVGFFGFIGGFALGMMVLMFLLKNVSKEDLLNDPYIKWKYGILNWAIAGLGVYSAISMYERYFL